MFYRINENGNAQILNSSDGSIVTKINANVYPVGSNLSAKYEHIDGIELTIDDAELIGISRE